MSSLCADGVILCDGRLPGTAWPARALCGLPVQRSPEVSQQRDAPVADRKAAQPAKHVGVAESPLAGPPVNPEDCSYRHSFSNETLLGAKHV